MTTTRWFVSTTSFVVFGASGSMRCTQSDKPLRNEENVTNHELASPYR